MTEQIPLPSRSELILGRLSWAEREVIERDQQARAALSALSTHSPGLTQILAVRSDLVREIFLDLIFTRPADLKNMAVLVRAMVNNARDPSEVKHVLRLYRLKELARLAVRDLTGRADLVEVMDTLSTLAEACLQVALTVAVGLAAERFGLTRETLGLKPVILGMGKLGAGELNYSSDVDLIYLYRPTAQGRTDPSPERVADFIFTTVTKIMSEVTEDGFIFRVDLDLRPGGKDGAQAQSLEKALKHYLNLGQPWERMALLKARPVAGDFEAGQTFITEVMPFIFRRHLDYTTLEELVSLKKRFARENSARLMRRSGAGRGKPALDVKLSPGGIREIEFFAQALSLTFGGRLPHLRQNKTLKALVALSREKIISQEDRQILSDAYVFLRTVEHRIQLRDLTQTQMLPRDEGVLADLALSMGLIDDPPAGFLKELDRHMSRVGRRFAALLSDPGEKTKAAIDHRGLPDWAGRLEDILQNESETREVLVQAGFTRPEAARAACLNIMEGAFLPVSLSRYRTNLERLGPVLISAAAKTPDPDRAIIHLERFLASIGPKAGFLVLLEENHFLVDSLATLFGASDHLSEILINHPAILDSLVDRRSAVFLKSKSNMLAELDTMLSLEEDPEARLIVIRRFKNDETLRIGLYDLLNRLSLVKIQSQLTTLAEVVMQRTMDLVIQLVLGRVPDSASIPLVIMGLGKLGGREMNYGSDLDLIFILGEDLQDAGLDMEKVVRVSQRFISYLSLHLEAGPGYQIDSRLRPSGRQGPLVVTLDSFARYHETSQLWEKQALLKMRPILGSAGAAGRVRALANELLFQGDLPADAAQKIDGLRQRMARERGRIKPGTVNLKFSPGGLVDIEFLTQYLQLVHGRTMTGAVRSPSTKIALKAMVKNNLGPTGLEKLIPAYDIISRAASRLGLIYNRAGDRAAYNEEEISRCDLPGTGKDPLHSLLSSMEAVSAICGTVFEAKENHDG